MSFVVYNPFISKKEIPESIATRPIQLDFPTYTPGGQKAEPVIPGNEYVPKFSFKQETSVQQTPQQEIRTILSGKHQFKDKNIKVGRMQEFLDIAASEGIYFRVTSGLREGAVTSNGNTSNHATGSALDITPIDGESWEQLDDKIRKSKKLKEYMKRNKMRLLDERSKEVLAQTGGTGAHYHFSFGKTEGVDASDYFA